MSFPLFHPSSNCNLAQKPFKNTIRTHHHQNHHSIYTNFTIIKKPFFLNNNASSSFTPTAPVLKAIEFFGDLPPTSKQIDGICHDKSTWNYLPDHNFDFNHFISKSDEDFLKQNIEFVYGYESINIDDLNDLFGDVGFPRRRPEKLLKALENTHIVIWIKHTKKTRWAKKGQLLGFGRAISDGVFCAGIWDVAVLPAWQKLGLGRGLMERIIIKLLQNNVNMITLHAEPNVIGLYEKLGFVKDIKGIVGMAYDKRFAYSRKNRGINNFM